MMSSQPVDRETIRIQMPQCNETIRHLTGLFVQAIGFFTASNVLLFGYGLTQRKSGAILVAAIMPLAVISARSIIFRNLIPICYVAMKCERILAPGETTLAITYIHARYPQIYTRLDTILNSEAESELRALRKVGGPGHRNLLDLWYFAGSVLQFIIFLLAQTTFHYHFI
jgi:hypothetical protein